MDSSLCLFEVFCIVDPNACRAFLLVTKMRAFNILRLLSLAGAVVVQHDVYDVVIAGAGTAGMVVANRLSERSDITVAVIEPGDDVRQDPAVKTIEFAFANFNASINWQYPSITQPELGSRNLSYRAGKAWGGTSSVNGTLCFGTKPLP